MKAIRLVVLLAVFGLLVGIAQAQVVVTGVAPGDRMVTFTVQNQGDRKINLHPSGGALGAQGTCPDPEGEDLFCLDPRLDLNTVWTSIEPSIVKGLRSGEEATFTLTITDDDRQGYALVKFNAGGSYGIAEIAYDGDGGPFIPYGSPDHTIQVQVADVDGDSVEFVIVNISDKVQGVSTSVQCLYDEDGDGINAVEAPKSKVVESFNTDKRGRLRPGGYQVVRVTPDNPGFHWIILVAGSGAGELHSYGYAVRP
jgi:hypothetical protein